jgi:hypothetical protein
VQELVRSASPAQARPPPNLLQQVLLLLLGVLLLPHVLLLLLQLGRSPDRWVLLRPAAAPR